MLHSLRVRVGLFGGGHEWAGERWVWWQVIRVVFYGKFIFLPAPLATSAWRSMRAGRKKVLRAGKKWRRSHLSSRKSSSRKTLRAVKNFTSRIRCPHPVALEDTIIIGRDHDRSLAPTFERTWKWPPVWCRHSRPSRRWADRWWYVRLPLLLLLLLLLPSHAHEVIIFVPSHRSHFP